MKRPEIIANILVLTALFSLLTAGCKNDADGDAGVEKSAVASVCVFYTPGSLGDGAYSDTLCYGVHKIALEKNLSVMDVCPAHWQDAEETVGMLLKTVGQVTGLKTLYIFADALYGSYLSPLLDKKLNNETFLLLDSRERSEQNLNSVFISFYGTSYLAGLAAKELLSAKQSPRVLSVLANDSSEVLLDSLKGFALGYGVEENAITIRNAFPAEGIGPDYFSEVSTGAFCAVRLSDSQGYYAGYKNAGFIYNAASVIQAAFPFDFYFPLCGSSIQGLLRYNREKGDKSFYTAGIDIDYSPYAKQVPFSIVKHIDKVAGDCIIKWLDGKLPHHQELRMGKDVMELVVSPDYAFLNKTVKAAEADAAKKEEAYENAKAKK